MKNIIKKVKGTKDYYPEDMYLRTWLYDHIRQVSESFGYQEWDAPFLETIELYAAKSGAEIVEKQSYVFEDRSGDRIALRPELTPSLARMVAKRQKQLIYPLRWWSFGPFWRYERPQKGRSREFFQWNIDMIGEDSPESDAELIALAATFLAKIGCTPKDVKILVNNRELMETELSAIGIEPTLRQSAYQLIDRKNKLSNEAWHSYAEKLGLSSDQTKAIEILINDKDLWKKSPALSNLFKALSAYDISDFVEFAAHIIRGLDYYTGTVFEAWDTAGEFRSLFGGGRYNDLVDDVGGQPVPAVGFAVGNMVITLLLEKIGKLPTPPKSSADIFVAIFDEEHTLPALKLASELRQSGFKVAIYPTAAKLGKQYKYADRVDIPIALLIGPDEITNNQVAVKILSSGKQYLEARNNLNSKLIKELEAQSAS